MRTQGPNEVFCLQSKSEKRLLEFFYCQITAVKMTHSVTQRSQISLSETFAYGILIQT